MVECKYCHKLFKSNVGLGIHKKSCDGWRKELGYKDNGSYTCKCGKEFKTRQSLITHGRFCPLYEKVPSKKSKYLIETYKNHLVYKCECGKEYENYLAFNGHLSHCDIHCKALGKIRKKRPSEKKKSMHWENKSPEEIKQIRQASGKTYSLRYKEGKIKDYWEGKHLPEEMKEKQRIGAINYIKRIKGDCKPRYSIKACKYINKLNEKNNWHLLHAENGGEFQIGGYFVDGYDKDLNIVFEYDESRHYKDWRNNELTDKDINRQNFIISKLNCEFWRYNEKLDLLYQV